MYNFGGFLFEDLFLLQGILPIIIKRTGIILSMQSAKRFRYLKVQILTLCRLSSKTDPFFIIFTFKTDPLI